MRKLIVSLVLLFTLTFSLFAQENAGGAQGNSEEVQMADKFREDGKIYVVVAIVTILFSGILVYLITLDRKVRKMEDELEGGAQK